MQKKSSSRLVNAGSSLESLRSKAVLTLREAASLLLGRTGDRYKASPELKSVVQRMRDADERGELKLKGSPLCVARAALDKWVAHIDRGWAKNLGVTFQDKATLEEREMLVDTPDATVTPAPRNLRAHYGRAIAENEELRARLAECEAEVQRLRKKRGRPPRNSLQKGK